jgi:outer membrane protein
MKAKRLNRFASDISRINPISMNLRIALFLFFLPILGFGQAQKWTLQQCIEYALENNLDVQQSQIQSAIQEENYLEQKQSIYPNLNFSSSYTNNFGLYVDPFTNELQKQKRTLNISMGLSAGVTLFSGLSTHHSIQSSKLNFESSVMSYEAIKNDISLNISTAFLTILFNKEILKVAEEQVKVTTEQVARTRELVNAGTLPRGNLFDIQAQLATEEQNLVAAENELLNSLLNLAQLLQLDQVSGFDIVTPVLDFRDERLMQLSPDQIFTTAVENQPIIRSAQLDILSAEHGLSAARGGYYPSLFLNLGMNSGATDITPDPISSQLGDNVSERITLTLSVPIYNRRQVKSAVNRSELNLLSNKMRLEQQKNQLLQTIQRAYLDAVSSRKQYEADVKSVQALQESFTYTEERFNVGVVNTLDYNTAKNNLTRAESNLLRSKYDYIFKMMVLEFYYSNKISL